MSAAPPLAYRARSESFLDPDRDGDAVPQDAQAVVVPFGLEKTTSWKTGTAAGPEAIIQASHALEMFDEELWCEPYLDFGVATLEAPAIPDSLTEALDQLESTVTAIAKDGRLPLILGGEHSLTPAAVKALAKKHDSLTVLQIDAHTDLRDSYQGDANSHACAMRRCLDLPNVSLVSVGLRSISAEEASFLKANRNRIADFWAKDWRDWDYDALLTRLEGRAIYITLDVDGLDPSIMPATGTPEPGGLLYGETCYILRKACEVGTIVGADIVELAPSPGLHACDFTAARLAYKILAYALTKESWL